MGRQRNQKAALLSKPIKHIDIQNFDSTLLIDAMDSMSFSSRELSKGTTIFNDMLRDKDCTIILTLAGSTSAAGCMKIYSDLVKYNMVDVIVATGASIVDMDFFEALGFRHYQAEKTVSDEKLRSLYINRIYDTYIDEKELQICDKTISKIAKSEVRSKFIIEILSPAKISNPTKPSAFAIYLSSPRGNPIGPAL